MDAEIPGWSQGGHSHVDWGDMAVLKRQLSELRNQPDLSPQHLDVHTVLTI